MDVEVFGDENFENRSMQNKMYLFVPQWESKGPAKSKLSSSFGSSKGEVYLFENLELNFLNSYPFLYVLNILCPGNRSVYRPPDVLSQVFHYELAGVCFM